MRCGDPESTGADLSAVENFDRLVAHSPDRIRKMPLANLNRQVADTRRIRRRVGFGNGPRGTADSRVPKMGRVTFHD